MDAITGVNANVASTAQDAALRNRLAASADGLRGAGSSDELKKRLGEFIGGVFFAPVLQEMQKSPFKTRYSDGGRGEEAFAGQLAIELSKRAGRAAGNGFAKRMISDVEKRVVRGNG